MTATIGKRRAIILLVLTLAVLASAALVLDRFHVGLDLTSDRTYSLSSVSRKLYKDLPDTLRITYYISPELSARHPGPRQIEDFLRKLEAAGRGKIRVSVQDPKSDSGALESLGLAPQRMQVMDKGEARVVVVYSGIVVEYRDRAEPIPFAIGLDTLEYDVVKAAYRAVSGKEAVAAVIVGDADKTWANDYRDLADALKASGWQVNVLNPGDEIPASTQALLVLGNADLDDYAAYRIDSYLAQGGAAFMAVRGVGIDTRYGLNAMALKSDALLRSLQAYGVKVSRDLVLDASSRTLPFQDKDANGGSSVRYVQYPHWVMVKAEDCDRKSPLTANFTGLDLMWPSRIDLIPQPGVTEAPLVRTSKKAWLQTKNFAVGPEQGDSYDTEAPSTTGQYLMAASLSGSLPEAYAGKPQPTRPGAAALPPLPAAAKPSRLVVVSSADFMTDLMELTDSSFNASFATNAVEWVSYGDELTALKARGSRDPRLSRVQDPAQKTAIELGAIILNVILIPAAFALVGFARTRRRKAEARQDAAPDGPHSQPDEKEGGKL